MFKIHPHFQVKHKKPKLKGPSKTQEQRGPGEAYFIFICQYTSGNNIQSNDVVTFTECVVQFSYRLIDSMVGKINRPSAAQDPALQQWGTNKSERDGTCQKSNRVHEHAR